MIQAAKQRAMYVAADFVSASLAWFLFNLLRYYTLPYNFAVLTLGKYMTMPMVILGQGLVPLMMVAMIAISGYYNKVFFKSRLDDVVNAGAVSIAASIIIFFTALFNDKIDDRMGNMEMVLTLWLLFTIITSVLRLVITSHTTRLIYRRKIAFNALIVGTSPQARELAHDLEHKHRAMGFHIVGFVDAENTEHPQADAIPIGRIEEAARELDVSSFIIVPGGIDTASTISLINRLLPLGKAVYLTPDTYNFIASRPHTSMVAGHVLMDVSSADIPASTLNLKRLADIACSAIALVALSPVMAVVALMIKRDSPGPVIYKQERIGYKKRPFNIYKFRSMRVDAEPNGPALSSPTDQRITRVGHVLRKYRLDELPQFWNVLKGDMSIVGPRPERQYFLSQIIERAPYYNIVHQVRPGITSWGVVKYGYASTVDQMLQRMNYDLLYVENISFVLDAKILFYTIRTVITGKGI